jgi:hypothetical protein
LRQPQEDSLDISISGNQIHKVNFKPDAETNNTGQDEVEKNTKKNKWFWATQVRIVNLFPFTK